MIDERAWRSSNQKWHLVSKRISLIRRPVSSWGNVVSWWPCWVAWDPSIIFSDDGMMVTTNKFTFSDGSVTLVIKFGWFHVFQIDLHLFTWNYRYFAWWVNNMCKFRVDPKKYITLQIDLCYVTLLSIGSEYNCYSKEYP